VKKNILISTGGSGGHVIPAMIIFQHLSEIAEVVISTDKRGLKYLDKNLYPVEIINTPKLNNIFFLPVNFFLIFKSIFLFKRKKIQKIISTGGYMSLPLILAARLLKIDIILLEPNQVLGRANRLFLNFCKKIFCYTEKIKNFPDKFRDRVVIINPLIKKESYNLKSLNKKKNELNLLIVGGSQGASIFDNNLKDLIVNISKNNQIKIIQQTSEKNVSSLTDFYSKNDIKNKIFSFDKNFETIIHQADLCITRAGASTLAELSFFNIPFITIPLPSSKDNHQFENANFYKNNDCCWLIEQNFFEEKIEQLLKEILSKKSDFLKKKENLKKLNYQNTWINVNQKILEVINEN